MHAGIKVFEFQKTEPPEKNDNKIEYKLQLVDTFRSLCVCGV